MPRERLTIVIPVLNEEAVLDRLADHLRAVLEGLDLSWEASVCRRRIDRRISCQVERHPWGGSPFFLDFVQPELRQGSGDRGRLSLRAWRRRDLNGCGLAASAQHNPTFHRVFRRQGYTIALLASGREA